MVHSSARTIYLLLASIIMLLFSSTAAYYFLSSEDKQDAVQLTDKTEKYIPPEHIQPTEFPLPTQAPATDSSTLATNLITASPSAYLAEEASASADREEPDTKLTADAENSTVLGCYDYCEYNYQCPSTMECIDVDGTLRCANPQCAEDASCTCTKKPQQLAQAEVYVQEPPTPKPQVGGLTTKSSLPTSTDSGRVAGTDDWNPELPKAGIQELTLAIFAVGIALSGFGYTWLKLRHYSSQQNPQETNS